jgi:K+-transporting ATPase ATPase C chain
MSQVRELWRAIHFTLILWAITAIIYPLVMIVFGQLVLPFQANGSLLKNDQEIVIGSALIGQPFKSDRYFWSRPSAVDYSTGEKAGTTGISGASNLAPSNPELLKRIQGEIDRLKLARIKPTADLVYISGSGLDPHISLEAARNQIQRVAQTRGLDSNQVESLITKSIEGRFLGIFGEPRVNVLKLNLVLDQYNQNEKP